MRQGIKYYLLFTAIFLFIGNIIAEKQSTSNNFAEQMSEKNEAVTFTLKDGKWLSYQEYGDTDGFPVVYCHGHPGSRLEYGVFDTENLAGQKQLRIIAIERPGVGLSHYKGGNWLESWPHDVIQLMDHLKIDTFGVLGISGGGPYALALANDYPVRVSNVVLISAVGPKNAPGMRKGLAWSYAKLPGPIRKMTLALTRMGIKEDPDVFIQQMIKSLSPPDALLLKENPRLANGIIQYGFREALKNKLKGVSHEARIYKKKWPFELANIKTKVFLWHGTEDANVPVSVGQFMAQALPNCEAKFVEKEGHLTIVLNYMPAYLDVFAK